MYSFSNLQKDSWVSKVDDLNQDYLYWRRKGERGCKCDFECLYEFFNKIISYNLPGILYYDGKIVKIFNDKKDYEEYLPTNR